MIRAELPDGTTLEFPDDTPDAVVQATVKRQLGVADKPAPAPAPQAEQGQAPGIYEGVKMGVGDIVQGGAQLLANALPTSWVDFVNEMTKKINELPGIGAATKAIGLVPATPQQINEQTTKREADYQTRRGQSGFDFPRLAGNIAGTVPLAAIFPAGASLPAAAGWGALGSGAISALNPVEEATTENFGMKKAKQVLGGGIAGLVAGPVGYVAGKAVAPTIAPEVRKLANEGVDMTPGQILGGTARRAEDAFTSWPIIGDQIRAGQTASIEGLNRAAVNRALAPIGGKVAKDAPVGRQMLAEAAEQVSKAYDDVLPKLSVLPDQQFATDILDIAQKNLVPSARKVFLAKIKDQVMGRVGNLGNQPLTGDALKKVESELNRLATNYKSSAIASERELGDAFADTLSAFRALRTRTNPQESARLGAIDSAYSLLQKVETAAGRLGAKEGVFTPAQLQSAVRQTDKSLRNKAFVRGQAGMQDLSEAANAVLPRVVPDSGTPERGLYAMLAAAAAGGTGAVNPALAGAAAVPFAMYSPAGRRALQTFLTAQRPQAVQQFGNFLAGSGPLAGALLAPSLNQ